MKASKVLSLVLTLAILVICTVAITASAEAKPTVEIVSKNLSYDSNISILFAVKTTNTDVAPTLNVYTEVDNKLTLNKTITPTFVPENSLEKVGFAEAYIFFTDGIVAKHLDTEIYVEAVVGEYKSAMERYSVIEYCHEMNAQKSTNMYTKIIEYSALVQKMLKEDGKFDGALATDYKYVTIEGGTLDGTYNSGIYLKGDELTLSADNTTTWEANDGKRFTNGDTYTVADTDVNFRKALAIDYKDGTCDMELLPESYYNRNFAISANFGWGARGTLDVKRFTTYCPVFDENANTKRYKLVGSTDTTGTLYHTDSKVSIDSTNLTLSNYNSETTNGFETSFDFKFDEGVETQYIFGIQASIPSGTTAKATTVEVYSISIKTNNDGITVANYASNAKESESVSLFSKFSNTYNHIAFKVVEKNNDLVCEIWANGTYITDFTTQKTHHTDLSTFYQTSIMAKCSNPIYLDNVYVGFYGN